MNALIVTEVHDKYAAVHCKCLNKILVGLLVTAMTVSLVASSVVFLADSADADRGDKVKEKIKKALDKIKEKTGRGGHGPGGDPPGRGVDR